MTTLQELLKQWEARSKDALPTDAMLINKHIRELRTALAQQATLVPQEWTNLLAYALQDDMHNRLTPRVVDIAYTAFTLAKRPNSEDGGASDWFNDTKPKVTELIAKLRKDLIEEFAAAPAPQPAQGEQQPVCYGCGIPVGDVHMSTCKSGKWPSRVSNGDTAAPAQKPVAYITQTEQGPMVWTPEMYDEACTYCDDGEFPVPLYTAAPAPVAQQPVAWYEYNQDLDAWFLAYGHNPKAKTRPLVFGDTAAPAPVAQQGEQQQVVKEVVVHADYRAMWQEVTRQNQQLCAALSAAPAPQAQDKSDNYLSGYCTGRTDLLKEQSAQPVAQPLTLEQILDIVKKLDETPDMSHVDVLKTFARAIEKAHGINYEK